MLSGSRIVTLTVGELVAVIVEEDDPDVEREEVPTLCLRGEEGVGTLGGGRGQSPSVVA